MTFPGTPFKIWVIIIPLALASAVGSTPARAACDIKTVTRALSGFFYGRHTRWDEVERAKKNYEYALTHPESNLKLQPPGSNEEWAAFILTAGDRTKVDLGTFAEKLKNGWGPERRTLQNALRSLRYEGGASPEDLQRAFATLFYISNPQSLPQELASKLPLIPGWLRTGFPTTPGWLVQQYAHSLIMTHSVMETAQALGFLRSPSTIKAFQIWLDQHHNIYKLALQGSLNAASIRYLGMPYGLPDFKFMNGKELSPAIYAKAEKFGFNSVKTEAMVELGWKGAAGQAAWNAASYLVATAITGVLTYYLVKNFQQIYGYTVFGGKALWAWLTGTLDEQMTDLQDKQTAYMIRADQYKSFVNTYPGLEEWSADHYRDDLAFRIQADAIMKTPGFKSEFKSNIEFLTTQMPEYKLKVRITPEEKKSGVSNRLTPEQNRADMYQSLKPLYLYAHGLEWNPKSYVTDFTYHQEVDNLLASPEYKSLDVELKKKIYSIPDEKFKPVTPYGAPPATAQ